MPQKSHNHLGFFWNNNCLKFVLGPPTYFVGSHTVLGSNVGLILYYLPVYLYSTIHSLNYLEDCEANSLAIYVSTLYQIIY